MGSNFEISIKDTVNCISEVMKCKVDIICDEQRKRPKQSEVERLFASNKKAKKLLNWKPDYAGIDGFKRGLKKTVEWFLIQDNLAKYNANIYNK